MKFLKEIGVLLKGIAIGVANIIPGVSGGTMAVVLGIYERLIEAIGGIFTKPKDFWGHFAFLALIGAGAVIGIKGLAPVITYALENHQQLTLLFFMGLIAGSIPTVVKAAGVKRLSIWDMLFLSLGVVLVLAMGELPHSGDGANSTGVALFFSGVLAGGAMIVPGVSGSLVLILLGTYSVVLEAIDKLSLGTLAIVGLGAVVGIAAFSLVIRALLKHRPNPTHAFIFGLVAASVVVLFEGFPEGAMGIASGSVSFVLGSLIAHASGKLGKTQEA